VSLGCDRGCADLEKTPQVPLKHETVDQAAYDPEWS